MNEISESSSNMSFLSSSQVELVNNKCHYINIGNNEFIFVYKSKNYYEH